MVEDRVRRKSILNINSKKLKFSLYSFKNKSLNFFYCSSKFWRKLVYVRSLDELYGLVTVEKTAIPDKVKMFDAKHM